MFKKSLSVAIIGAGVLGTAIAYTIKKSFKDSVEVILIEKHTAAGQETSKFNSGVLHSGIHSKPDTLKAKFARSGNLMAKDYCQRNGVPINECGMLIVAAYRDLIYLTKKIRNFWNIYNHGREQNIEMKILMPWEISRIEPEVRGAGAIFIPDVAVIDQEKFVQSIFKSGKDLGVQMFLDTQVIGFRNMAGKYYVETNKSTIETDVVINAAGLYADEIAKMAGFDQYKIYPYRGEYYEVLGPEAKLVNRLVYPVPIEGDPGKGIHFLKTTDGRLLLGPNARLVPNKEYYKQDKTPAEVFKKAAVRFCPALKNAELKWAYSGIRPKLTLKDDIYHESDFIFSLDHQSPFFLNIIGYESPGLSGALAAAEYVKNILNKI